MIAIGEKALEVVLCDLMNGSIQAGYEKEQEYLQEQKQLLEEKRDFLMEEVAKKLGELVFYCSKIEEIDDRIFDIKIGDAQSKDYSNDETKSYMETFTKEFLSRINLKKNAARSENNGKKEQRQVDAE